MNIYRKINKYQTLSADDEFRLSLAALMRFAYETLLYGKADRPGLEAALRAVMTLSKHAGIDLTQDE